MHFTLLNGIQCIQSYCMDPTAFNRYQLHQAALIHFIQSRYNAPLCIESTALKHAAWNPLHSIRYHWATLHGTHSIPLGSIAPCCMEYTPFKTDTFAKIHGIHYIHSRCISHHCIESTAFNRDLLPHASCNPLHSLGMHFTLLH